MGNEGRGHSIRKGAVIRLTVEPVGTAEERRQRLARFVEGVLTLSQGGEGLPGDRRGAGPVSGAGERRSGGAGR